MDELTVQELIDYLLTVENKNKIVTTIDDNGNESNLYIHSTNDTTVFLGQFYED